MRVLMIAPQPYFEPRGTPISVNQRLTALSEMGHQVDLLTYHVGEDTPMNGVNIHRLPRIPFIRSVRIGPSVAKLFLDVLLFVKAILMLARRQYDVIHTHEEAAFMGVALAKVFGPYHFYDMHSSLPRQLENFQYGNFTLIIRAFEYLEDLVLRTADAIITVGEDLEQYVKSIHPHANVWRIENVPVVVGEENGALRDISEMVRPWKDDGKSVVVYTGNFEKYQGLEGLVQGIAKARAQDHDVVLLLVGGTEDQVDIMRSYLEQQDLSDHCLLVGRVSVEEALAYMQVADVLVSPRVVGTTIPLKIYSYISTGKPIVASNIPAHRQVLEDGAAVLVEPTSSGIAEGLTRILRDEDLKHRLGENSLGLARRLGSTATLVDQMEALYQDGALRSGGLKQASHSAPK